MMKLQDQSKSQKGNSSMNMNMGQNGIRPGMQGSLLSAPWCDETDSGYSNELARRSVARAALNLGIDSMSGDALDGMGDVLVSYLERMGQTMAAIAEAGNRSSAHCNILDAIDAIEMNMLPSQGGDDHNDTKKGWEKLASFAFGSEWRDKVIDFDTGIIQSERAMRKEKEKQKIEMEAKIAAAKAAASAAATAAAIATSNGAQVQAQGQNNTVPRNQPPALAGHKKNGDKLRNLTQKNPQLANSLSGMQQSSGTNNNNNNNNGNAKSDTDAKNKNANNKENDEKSDQEDEDGAWNAPYLDVVPIYPLIKDSSRLNASLQIGSMMLATQEEACRGENDGIPGFLSDAAIAQNIQNAEKKADWDLDRIPSRNFFASSSNLKNINTKKNADSENADASGNTSKKRARFDDSIENSEGPNAKRQRSSSSKDTSSISTNGSHLGSSHSRPSYIPGFLPAFPPKHTYQPIASRDSANTSSRSRNRRGLLTASSKGDLSIRRSLVHQQQQKQQQRFGDVDGKDLSLTVPSGNISALDSIHEDKKKDLARNGGAGSSITPLEKISVSRVSKILEGSMDLFNSS